MKGLKNRIYIVLMLLMCCISFEAYAQRFHFNRFDKHIAAETDSSAVRSAVRMDYASLMECVGSSINMSDSLTVAMYKQVEKNKSRKTTGYRVRIYFDNSREARVVSEQIVDTFKVSYPDIPVFRIYDNPYFKVTVGEFFTRADAMRFMEAIRREYPTVFLVKESFSTN